MNKEQELYGEKVTRSDIERAISDLRGYSEAKGYAKRRRSTLYCLEVEGYPRHLPPKVVISRSALYVLGHELAAGKFNGGEEYANKLLRNLGYGSQIKACGTKHCGGRG